jgi:hypothetical protein
MNREKAIEILGFDPVNEVEIEHCNSYIKIEWCPEIGLCEMEGDFTAEQLKALTWWMEEYGTKD